MVDLCRQSLVFESVREVAACFRTIAADPAVRLLRVKNRLDPSYDPAHTAGYRDVGLNFQVVALFFGSAFLLSSGLVSLFLYPSLPPYLLHSLTISLTLSRFLTFSSLFDTEPIKLVSVSVARTSFLLVRAALALALSLAFISSFLPLVFSTSLPLRPQRMGGEK